MPLDSAVTEIHRERSYFADVPVKIRDSFFQYRYGMEGGPFICLTESRRMVIG